MSSDLFPFDHDPFYRHSSSDMVSSDGDLTFLADSPIDIFRAISDSQNQQNPVDESHSFDHYSSTTLLSSSPSQQFESLNLYQTTHLQCLQNGSDFDNGLGNLSGFDGLEVKNEECQLGFESSFNQAFLPHSYSGGGAENVAKLIQRSYSSNCFDGKTGFLFQPRFDTLMESPTFQNHALSPPENTFFGGQMRRVCSTGDLQVSNCLSFFFLPMFFNLISNSISVLFSLFFQNTKAPHATHGHRSYSSSLAVETSFNEETNFKVGRYSAEERKERISKYKAKRNQRNFNKTIKVYRFG